MKRIYLIAIATCVTCLLAAAPVAWADDAGLMSGQAATNTVTVAAGEQTYTLSYGDKCVAGPGISSSTISNDYQLLLTALFTANRDSSEKVTITLEKGKTYEIGNLLRVFSHTDLNLNGATIKRTGDGSKGMIYNYPIGWYGTSGVARESAEAGGYKMSTDITIRNGTINGGSPSKASDLVRIDHASGITIEDVTFKNVYNCHHLEFVGVKDATVARCAFSGYTGKQALEAVELDAAWTDNPGKKGTDPTTWSSKNRWASDTYLDGTNDQNVVVENCTFTNLGTALGEHHYSTDSRYSNSKNIVIRNNAIQSTLSAQKLGYAYKPAMTIGGLDSVTVSGNTISGPYTFLIQTYRGTSISIIDNVLSGSTKNMIMVDAGSKGASVTGNKLEGGAKHGISVTDGAVKSISKNTVANVKGNGINVNSGTVAKVSGNTVKKSGGNAISVPGGTVKSIASNKVSTTASASNGITVTGGKVTAIKGNTISSAGKNGISITKGTVGTKGKASTGILKNTIKKAMRGHGISVSQSATAANIISNKISNPRDNGISISGSPNVYLVKSNTISKPSWRWGIWSNTTKATVEVQGNKITVAEPGYAIGTAAGTATKVSGNKIATK